MVLHSLLASVHSLSSSEEQECAPSSTPSILAFNSTCSGHTQAFLTHLLKLVLALVMLEEVAAFLLFLSSPSFSSFFL